MEKSWLVRPPRQGFPHLHLLLLKPGPRVHGRVEIVEASLGCRLENSTLLLNILILETCTFLHGNATKRVRKPAFPVPFLDRETFSLVQ